MKRDRVSHFLMSIDLADLRSLGDVPQPDRLVRGCRGHELAVGAPGHAVNLGRMTGQVFGSARRGKRPERDDLVGGAREQRCRIGRKATAVTAAPELLKLAARPWPSRPWSGRTP